jgi:hypothetical protein
LFLFLVSSTNDGETQKNDWFFHDYTFKRFGGLTARPSLKMSMPLAASYSSSSN